MDRTVTVTYYGMLAEALGFRDERINIGHEVNDLRNVLISKHPTLKDYTFSIAVDMEYRDTLALGEKPQKIDVMPPFAGG